MKKSHILRFAEHFIDEDILLDIIFSPAVSSVHTSFLDGELIVRVYFYDDTTCIMYLESEVF